MGKMHAFFSISVFKPRDHLWTLFKFYHHYHQLILKNFSFMNISKKKMELIRTRSVTIGSNGETNSPESLRLRSDLPGSGEN